MTDLVFAYGSNMNRRQMADRCPGARRVCVARLSDHRLAFAGSSAAWGGGVATILPARRSVVNGIVWRLSPANLLRLDAFEGYPYVYDRIAVPVLDERGKRIWCVTYVKEHAEFDEPPSATYLQVILEGYEWAGVPVPTRLKSLLKRSIYHAFP